MTRPMSEPSLPGQVNRNKFGVRDLRRRPLAGRWYQPGCSTVNDADCKGDEPALQNSWAQPAAPLEKFAFRRHMDGSLEFRGHLDASGGAVSGTVAVTLPGDVGSEPNFLPANDQDWHTTIRTAAGVSPTAFTLALVQVSATTGAVTIWWPAV